MTHVTFDDPVMQEEIFGPVLPVLTYENFEELMLLLKNVPSRWLSIFSAAIKHTSAG